MVPLKKHQHPAGRMLVELRGLFKINEKNGFDPPEIAAVQELLNRHQLPIKIVEESHPRFQVAKQHTTFYWGRYFNYLASLVSRYFVDQADGGGGEFDWPQFIANPAMYGQRRFVVEYVNNNADVPSRYRSVTRTTALKSSTLATLAVAVYRTGQCTSVTTVDANLFVTTSTFTGCWLFIFKDPVSENVELMHCGRDHLGMNGYDEAIVLRDANGHNLWTLTHVMVNHRNRAELAEVRYNGLAKCSYQGNGETCFYGTRPDAVTPFAYSISTSPSEGGGIVMFHHATVTACA